MSKITVKNQTDDPSFEYLSSMYDDEATESQMLTSLLLLENNESAKDNWINMNAVSHFFKKQPITDARLFLRKTRHALEEKPEQPLSLCLEQELTEDDVEQIKKALNANDTEIEKALEGMEQYQRISASLNNRSTPDGLAFMRKVRAQINDQQKSIVIPFFQKTPTKKRQFLEQFSVAACACLFSVVAIQLYQSNQLTKEDSLVNVENNNSLSSAASTQYPYYFNVPPLDTQSVGSRSISTVPLNTTINKSITKTEEKKAKAPKEKLSK